MTPMLFDVNGVRKYLVAQERSAFARAALEQEARIRAFCLTLAFTGARLSEVLALTTERLDTENGAIVFETLKRRRCGDFRAVPVPISLLSIVKHESEALTRLWPWGRTTAWKLVKEVMRDAKIAEVLCKPKALRHAFAIEAVLQGVPLNVVQRWMGHARMETTAIYANVIGREERALARLAWRNLETATFRRGRD